jgi:transcriptional regulator with XRE-family HTH domain
MLFRMVNKPSPAASQPIPRRLRLLRLAEGYDTAAKFAEKLGISPARYGNIEAGSNLSIEVAQLIVNVVPGISLDWLYNAREDGLSVSLRQRLASAAAQTEQGAGNVKTTAPSRSGKAATKGRSSTGRSSSSPR